MLMEPTSLILTSPGLAGVELLRKLTFSAATSATFSGLNGDYDDRYLIEFRGDITGVVDKTILVRPNGDSGANYKAVEHEFSEQGTTAAQYANSRDSKNGLPLCRTGWSHNGFLWGKGVLDAKTGKNRLWRSWASGLDTSDPTKAMRFDNGGVWKNTASLITSLVLDFESASVTGELWLYRMKRPL